MNLAWLAAVLSPFEIASHPNFGSTGGVRPEADLAALLLGQTPSWRRVERHLARDESDNSPVDTDVRLVYDALYTGNDAGRQLFERVFTDSDSDSARSTALSLVACVIASMDDNYELCESIASHALQRLASDDVESNLCRAALLQQRALRRHDAGLESQNDSIAVASMLESLDIHGFQEFATNGVTTKSCHAIVDDIRWTLIKASWSTSNSPMFSEGAIGPIPSKRDQLFSAPSDQLTRLAHSELSEYYRYVERAYDKLLRRAPQTVLGGSDPDVLFEVFAYELYGHAGVVHNRKQLAMMRVAQNFPALENVNVSDALRLLRQSGAESELRQLIGQLLQSGPLDGILVDARRILRHRRRPEAVRVVELVVLEAAADLLPSSEASTLLDFVLEVLQSGGPSDPPGRWQALQKRLESAWQTAAAVANAAGAAGRFADYLLASVDSDRMSDQLWDRAYARAIGRIEWTTVPQSVISAWRATLKEIEPAGEFSRSVFDDEALANDAELPPAESLTEYAEAINNYLRKDQPIPAQLIDSASALALSGIELIRREARGHTYSGRVSDPAEVLAVLLIESGRPELADPLLALLADPQVAHASRARAFDLLSENRVAAVANKISEYRNGLESAILQPDPFAWAAAESSSTLFPAAMRFCAVYNISNEYQTFGYVATLAAATDHFFKLEAAKSVRAFVKSTNFNWLLSMSLQLTFDIFPDVKVVAIHCLGELIKKDRLVSGAAVERLGQLLDDDGITVPLAVLRAIKTLEETPPPLRDKAISMASNHLSRRVRGEAASI